MPKDTRKKQKFQHKYRKRKQNSPDRQIGLNVL